MKKAGTTTSPRRQNGDRRTKTYGGEKRKEIIVCGCWVGTGQSKLVWEKEFAGFIRLATLGKRGGKDSDWSVWEPMTATGKRESEHALLTDNLKGSGRAGEGVYRRDEKKKTM